MRSDRARDALLAAISAAAQGDFTQREPFLAALRSGDESLQLTAAEALGEIGPRFAIEPLGALLATDAADVRNQVINALGRIARPEVVPWLIRALADEDIERQEDARAALVQVVGHDAPISDDGDEDPDEADRVDRWWSAKRERFQPDLVYDLGVPISIASWISEMTNAPKYRRSWIDRRLRWWTGLEMGSPDDRRTTTSWAEWWRGPHDVYEPGHRYYHGRRVDV